MKNLILALILIGYGGFSWAQSPMEAMKLLTVNSLMQYGQKLYDRGNYDQASAVFSHVLIYDRQQAQALAYLKKMGRLDHSGGPAIELDATHLKEAIEAKKKSIAQLNGEIAQMRTRIVLES